LGQLHFPPLSQEQFMRPHAEHFMANLLRHALVQWRCHAGQRFESLP